jgi:sulfatase maturation enzyme AslB (radical SAM superfamily)
MKCTNNQYYKSRAFIFGAGKLGKLCLPMLKEEYDILGYLDNNPDLWNSNVSGIEVFPPNIVGQKEFDIIFTAVSGYHISSINKQLLSYGVDKQKIAYVKKYPKPFSQHSIDIHLTEHCNLNCAGCSNFSPLAKKEFVDVKIFERDLKRLSKLTNKNVGRILLLGGEPLLHPEVVQLIDIAGKYFSKATKMILLTNGILLTKQPQEFWECAKRNELFIRISHYPIKLDINKIKELSALHSVAIAYDYSDNFLCSEPKSMCKQKYDLEGNGDMQANFHGCWLGNQCLTLKNGLLYPCSHAAHSEHFFNKFGFLKKCSEDSIDIHKAKDEKELSDFVSKPIPFCRFCIGAIGGLKWKPSKKEISEWT